MNIGLILETKEVLVYLRKRNLIVQYQKAKQHILIGHYSGVQLRKREPKTDDVWYFRINKQFRALAYLDAGILKVFTIDNH